jgi:hypothetical protein
LNLVIKRSFAAGVKSIIITGGSLSDSRSAIDCAVSLGNQFFF